jgi:hypothetical protein
MGLFSRKQAVRLAQFCGEFYDTQILNPVIEGIDAGQVYVETVRRSVMEADPSFEGVETASLATEITAIRFEVFGLAWLHQFAGKHAAAQSAFTKRYLEERNRADVWEAMEAYNQASARSSTLGHTPKTPSGRAHLVFIDKTRADLFDAWLKQGFEPEPVARAANRFGTDVAWERNLTPGFLMLTLCQRLGCEVNEEGQFRLIAVIRGLYDGVREALRSIKIEAS